MSEPTRRNRLIETGWFIKRVGWGICVASIYFALRMKSSGPPYTVLFFACLAILVGVSVTYFIARRVSDSWMPKAVRSYFSPYIVGATMWLSLIFLLVIIYRFFG
jgi:hypothetical protein